MPELSVRTIDAGAASKPALAPAAQYTVWHIAAAAFVALACTGLLVGLAMGYALPRGTNNVPVPVPVVPDWAKFPAEAGAAWNYDTADAIGPANWGTIKDSAGALKYPVCASTAQSPINIVTASAVAGTPASYRPQRFYNATAFKIGARPGGHPGFQVLPINGTADWMVDGVAYKLLQFHYHSPSEHTVNGVQYPLEVHFVHQNAAGALAVFGILYPFSEDHGVKANPFIAQWWDQIFTEVRAAVQPFAACLGATRASPPPS